MSEYTFFNDEPQDDEDENDGWGDDSNLFFDDVDPASNEPQTEASPTEASAKARQEPTRSGKLVSTRVSDIEYEPVEWLWKDRIPTGALTLLAGDPGLGKSTLACLLAAELSTGALTGTPGTTLILNAEDNPGSVIQPRLEAAGADLNRVETVGAHEDGFVVPAYFPGLTADLAELIAEKEAKLVIIDPMLAYLDGSIDAFKDQSVRKALRPLHDVAEASNAAVLMVTHLNKGVGATPLHRIGGSVGIPAAARSVLLFAKDPNDPDGEQGVLRVLAQVKSNFGRLAASLSYGLESHPISSQNGQETGLLKQFGEIKFAPSELLEPAGPPREREVAMAFLTAQLANGSVPSSEMERKALEAGIAERTLVRAKKDLRVPSVRNGAGWDWAAPTPVEASNDEPAPF